MNPHAWQRPVGSWFGSWAIGVVLLAAPAPGQSIAPLVPAEGDDVGFDAAPLQRVVGPVEVLTPPRGVPFATRGSTRMIHSFARTAVLPEGDTPSDILFTPDGTQILIAHRDSQNLVVFDAVTRDVVQTIPVSGSPNSLAITADGMTVVTANLFEDTASIIDLASGVETFVVDVGDQPGVARVTPDGTRAIIGNTVDSTLSVVDLATGTELYQIPGASFTLTTSFGAWAITYQFTDYRCLADNDTVIFPATFDDELVFFDISDGSANIVATQPGPARLDISPDGTLAVLSHNYPQSRVTIVDLLTETIVNSFTTGASATSMPAIAMNPSKTKAVIAVQNAVLVMNLATGATSAALSTGTPATLDTTADGLYCVVGNYQGSIISYATESIVKTTLDTTTPDYLAVSPIHPRAATAHALRNEFMEVLNTAGASGYQEDKVLTGPPPEGDKARNVAVASDASFALVVNNHSQNVTRIDLATLSVVDTYNVGVRPGGVAITPDDALAVVNNLDSYFTSVIDLADGTVTNIAMGRRGSMVAISPDGVYAYVPVVADGDGVYRINLNTLSLQGPKVGTGNMSGIGFVFDLASGMTLSHDGGTLAVCGSFDDTVSILDTAAWAEVKRLTVGDQPVRAAFSPDDSTIYVTNKNSHNVTVIDNAGSGSSVIDTFGVGNQPFELTPNPAGTRLYVANFDARSISVVSLPDHTVVDTIPLPQPSGAGQPVGLHCSADGGWLYVACNGADFHRIDLSDHTIAETLNTGLAPAELKFDDATNQAFVPSPFGADGLSVILVTETGDLNCDGAVDFKDINPFVLALSSPASYLTAYPNCDILLGDLNDDGAVNLQDINPFVLLLSGG